MPRSGNTLSSLLLAILVLLLAAPPAAGQTGAPTPLRIETRDLEREVGAAREAWAPCRKARVPRSCRTA
jgi:hypothetical protein